MGVLAVLLMTLHTHAQIKIQTEKHYEKYKVLSDFLVSSKLRLNDDESHLTVCKCRIEYFIFIISPNFRHFFPKTL